MPATATGELQAAGKPSCSDRISPDKGGRIIVAQRRRLRIDVAIIFGAAYRAIYLSLARVTRSIYVWWKYVEIGEEGEKGFVEVV